MKMVYVAHPYGGKEENKRKVGEIIKELSKNDPDTFYVSPIHATGFMYFAVSHEQGMEYCKELLSRCDELYLCKGWEWSTGCKIERRYALSHGIPITYEEGVAK